MTPAMKRSFRIRNNVIIILIYSFMKRVESIYSFLKRVESILHLFFLHEVTRKNMTDSVSWRKAESSKNIVLNQLRRALTYIGVLLAY